jgi:hypothetical protein
MKKTGQGESPHLAWATAHAEELKQWKGLWVAVNAEKGVVASGQSMLTTTQEAESQGWKGKAAIIHVDDSGHLDQEAALIAEFFAVEESILVNRILTIALKDAELRDVNSRPDLDEVWHYVKGKPFLNFFQTMKAKIDNMKFSKEDQPWAYFSLGKIHGGFIMRAQEEGATLEEILGTSRD